MTLFVAKIYELDDFSHSHQLLLLVIIVKFNLNCCYFRHSYKKSPVLTSLHQ
jgi:hypothetical protein